MTHAYNVAISVDVIYEISSETPMTPTEIHNTAIDAFKTAPFNCWPNEKIHRNVCWSDTTVSNVRIDYPMGNVGTYDLHPVKDDKDTE